MAIDEPPESALPALVTQDPTVGLARLEAERARTDADRARANRIPDPVLGVRFSEERGGNERLAGLTISIPLSGALRAAERDRSTARAHLLENRVSLVKQQQTQQRIELNTVRQSALTRARYLDTEYQARSAAASVLLRAYEAGDGDLITVSMAEREARRSNLGAVEARIDAWHAHALLTLYPDAE
jgi:hypothetical protein